LIRQFCRFDFQCVFHGFNSVAKRRCLSFLSKTAVIVDIETSTPCKLVRPFYFVAHQISRKGPHCKSGQAVALDFCAE